MFHLMRQEKEKQPLTIHIHNLGELVAAIDNLTANVAKLQADVAALVTALQSQPTNTAVQAQADAVAAVDATVVSTTQGLG